MQEIKQRGKYSFILPNKPVITAWASAAGKKESEGPLANTFDITKRDSYFGEKTWEQAEKRMQQLALEQLRKKSGLSKTDIGKIFQRLKKSIFSIFISSKILSSFIWNHCCNFFWNSYSFSFLFTL